MENEKCEMLIVSEKERKKLWKTLRRNVKNQSQKNEFEFVNFSF